ncbi:MAG: DUF1571 domain-containing protein [Planctomycetota bacterium]
MGARNPVDLRDAQERSAASDPLGFLKMCREHYLATVRDYRCLFHIRERFKSAEPGETDEEQQIAVGYREQPYSVDMRWLRNAAGAARVSYVAGRWARGGREMALIVPSGVLGLFAPWGVKGDIHGPEVRAASRRSVDQFGFKTTLDLILQYCETARGDPAFDLRFVGGGELDHRPCFVFERRLPYGDAAGVYPDRLLVIYVDREWLVPTGCFAYADEAGERPLGTYVTTDVKFNVGLTDADF